MARTVVRALGEVLVTVGVVLLLFVAYELWGTTLYTDQAQADLRESLQEQWASAGSAPDGPPGVGSAAAVGVADVPLGDGVAVLRVPLLGADWQPVVVEGVDRDALRRGPGRMPGSALPGEVGNVVISGHRTTYGAPFNRFDELVPGTPVVVETAGSWLTYRVREQRVVEPTAVEVTWPVPGERGATPTERLLTFTTCHPEFSARERLVVTAVLESEDPKDAGPPAVLAG